MSLEALNKCPECGIEGCRDIYGIMLAFEFEHPSVFSSVHHITVLCYNLQHSATFTEEARLFMRFSLRAVLAHELSSIKLREYVQKNSKAGMKIHHHDAHIKDDRRIVWSKTVKDIRIKGLETYKQDVVAWARSVLTDLERS